MFEGRQWYINKKAELVVQAVRGKEDVLNSYHKGQEVEGVFADHETYFTGVVLRVTKTCLVLDNWEVTH